MSERARFGAAMCRGWGASIPTSSACGSAGGLLGAVASVFLVLSSCGGTDPPALAPARVPDARGTRDRAIDAAGAEIYRRISAGDPAQLLADDVALRSLVDSGTASRYSALRLGLSARVSVGGLEFQVLREAEYGGVCLQGARLEPPGTSLGLLREGWVFERALVFGIQPGDRRIASWVEGVFLFTTRGFVALDLSRVEAPRWEHSDLELATCDMEVGLHHPRPVVEVTQ